MESNHSDMGSHPYGASNPCVPFFPLSLFDIESSHFDSGLSSLVSSPSAAGGGVGIENSSDIGRLIGRLGSMCNSGDMSCYGTPLQSPRGPMPGFGSQFVELSGILSRVSSSKSLGNPALDLGQSEVDLTSSKVKYRNNARKRNAAKKSKENDSLMEPEEGSGGKRSKLDAGGEIGSGIKVKVEDAKDGGEKVEQREAPKDYIHVRARRGQATDSHSLAERVRREKIGERMKLLQALVPGCSKVVGKALVLEEIINYIQSLQWHVEFLSMKLADLKPQLDDTDNPLQLEDMNQGTMWTSASASTPFSYCQQSQGTHPPYSSDSTFHHGLVARSLPAVSFDAQFGAFWNDDLQSVVQMGYRQSLEADFTSHNSCGK